MSILQQITRRFSLYLKIFLFLGMIAIISVLGLFSYHGRELPDYRQLESYNPPLVSRVYSGNGRLMQEYAVEKRIYIDYDKIPPMVINAFLSAEDKNFFHHQGLDYFGIIRAATKNLLNLGRNKGLSGGSTITQQVVKNFLLTNERSLDRKIKEAILAYRISNVYSKEKILELYLNQIFLGQNSYGLVSSSLNYFNKDVSELSIAEAALLAAMPKAPSYVNPLRNKERATFRRDWVIERMLENDFITEEEAKTAISTPITIAKRRDTEFTTHSDFYAESVRADMVKMFGEKEVYSQGYSAFTYMDEGMQRVAAQSLRKGLLKYDREHGYRGPLARVDLAEGWQIALNKWLISLAYADTYTPAIVIKITDNKASIGFKDGKTGSIYLENLKWARKSKASQLLGPAITNVAEVLSEGDIILVSPAKDKADSFLLEQITEVEGAIVVMEVGTGKVLAIYGGYSFEKSKFNRAIQAGRQPGSAFKPLVYLTALENGYKPTTIVSDTPTCLPQGPGMPMWCPKNYGNNFLGDITMRRALEKSRNLPTVKIATDIGLDKIAEIAARLDIFSSAPKTLSVALGAYETTLLKLTNSYNIIASGGKKITPQFIDRIVDRKGNYLMHSSIASLVSSQADVQQISYPHNQLVDPAVSYQLTSLLEGAIKRGTGVRAAQLNWPLAGKTGTTNDSFDSWFIGYTPEIVVGVYIGFDQPKTLGQKETGASLALPIFIDFMKETLPKMPKVDFAIPDGIKIVDVYAANGQLASGQGTGPIIQEAFLVKPQTQSNDEPAPQKTSSTPLADLGSIY